MVEMTLCDFSSKAIKGDKISTWLLKDALGTQYHDVPLPKGAHPRGHLEKPGEGIPHGSQAQVPGDSQYQLLDMLVNIPDDSNPYPLNLSSGCPRHHGAETNYPHCISFFGLP